MTQDYSNVQLSNVNGSGNRIVMVTRLSKPKDPMTPIRAFAKVIKEVPEATFKIVGYGPLYEYANRLVQDLNLEGSGYNGWHEVRCEKVFVG